MENLTFNKGYKEYSVNGDENNVIRIYASNLNLIPKLEQLREKIALRMSVLKNVSDDFDKLLKEINIVERQVRAELDEAFGSPVSEAAFGNVNCLSLAGGKLIVLNFLEAIVSQIKEDFISETRRAEELVAKYVDTAKQYD